MLGLVIPTRNSPGKLEKTLSALAIQGLPRLRAALVGTRCILLNPYNLKGSNIDLFKKADILYEDIHAAIEAVNGYRQGRPEFAKLGLWDDIIDQFDPFRDGQSAVRLRECLEDIFQNHSAEPQRNAVKELLPVFVQSG